MAPDIYIQEEPTRRSLPRRLLAGLLSLALLAGLAVGGYIWFDQRQFDYYVSDYEQSLESGDFDRALSLYRQAQERALAPVPLESHSRRYQQILADIEQLTDQRLRTIERKLLNQERLSGDDLAFAEAMAEVTAIHLVQTLRSMAGRHLVGDMEYAPVYLAFSQLAGLENLQPALGDLPAQLPLLQQAAPSMTFAFRSYQQGEYWTAWQAYQDILADGAFAGFIHEQAQLRLETCQDEMYRPLLDDALTLMEGGRYLSAEEELMRLLDVYPDDANLQATLAEARRFIPPELVIYRGHPEFISIRPLIVDPEKAFDDDAYAAAAEDAMITVTEFRRILSALYANDYILIDSDLIYEADRSRAPLYLPPDKKPLVLVIDGLNYYASRRETGNAWDLVLDERGEVSAVYPDIRGNLIVDREGEMIGILDAFVKENPDFSLNGAKGTISLTGYEGIFGRVTHPHQLDDRNRALAANNHAPIELSLAEIEQNRKDVRQIIERLSATGWRFASSTYGYINASEHTMERIIDDTEKWLNQVGSLTGPVTMLNYPNGAFIPGADERATFLREQGFILFGGLGTQPYFFIGQDYFYVDKTPINGFTLRNSSHYRLERFFAADEVYDRENRPR